MTIASDNAPNTSPEETRPGTYDIAVILPVEFHRGQAIECLRGWILQQDFPADRYQIILGAPNTLDKETEKAMRALLRPWDRLEIMPFRHDVPLVDQAARLAESELLLFSETHCLPLPQALRTLHDAALAHPDWAGFSCPTLPITHNLLSTIEAEIYDVHIRGELESTGWLKVMDQCFVLRQGDYVAAGGFRAEFGHFAEWLLAAELHRRGKQVGFVATPVIRHYYVGDVDDLEAFTLDFARGQAKYLAECRDEPTWEYFPELPELEESRLRSVADHRQLALGHLAAMPTLLKDRFHRGRRGEPRASLSALLAHSTELLRSAYLPGARLRGAERKARGARRLLLKALQQDDRPQAKACFIDWFAQLVHLGRLQYLADNPAVQGSARRNSNFPISWQSEAGALSTTMRSELEWQGFYDEEITPEGKPIRWSGLAACLWLPLYEGRYRITIDLHPVRPLAASDLLRISFRGKPLGPAAITVASSQLVVDLEVPAKGWHPLAWSITPFPATGDRRFLGLPITVVRWFALNQAAAGPAVPPSPEGAASKPVYFLHVPKCAGTSLRLILENAFAARDILSPYAGRYYPQDLIDIAREPVHRFYRGHFRWALPAALPDLDWQVVTVLRHPVDRLLSRFYYLQQHQFIHQQKTFEEWFENDLALTDTLTVHLTSRADNGTGAGRLYVQSASREALAEALTNLEQCAVVGLFENLEDSVNLLAWHLGFLPPDLLPRNNQTSKRPAVEEITAELRARIEDTLAADLALYAHARTLFAQGMHELRSALPPGLGDSPDTASIRRWLRQERFDSVSRESTSSADCIEWTPDDLFLGDNLQARELIQGHCLRWTGPSETTPFHFFLGEAQDREMTLTLHPATPGNHVTAARLVVNDLPVQLEQRSSPAGSPCLVARLPREVMAQSQSGIATFKLTNPVITGAGEFRKLGLALQGIRFANCGQEEMRSVE